MRVIRSIFFKLSFVKLAFGMLLALVWMSHSWAQEVPASEAPKVGKPLSITISKSLYLPEEMYGQWSITGTLLETNAPDFFNDTVHDIWVLERSGDEVTISNPVNGASASINVDKVDGYTATFHRMVVSKKSNRIFFEMPTITVNGDRLIGTTINQFRYVRNGGIYRSYYARYKLEATRITTPGVRKRKANGPSFEIDDSSLSH